MRGPPASSEESPDRRFHRPAVEILSKFGGVPIEPGARRPYDLSHPELNGPSMADGAVAVPSAAPALV